MLLAEMLRDIATEEELDYTTTSVACANVHDWTLRRTVSFTLTAEQIIMYSFQRQYGEAELDSAGDFVNTQVRVDDVPVYAVGCIEMIMDAMWQTWTGFTKLASGAHTVKFYTSTPKDTGASLSWLQKTMVGIIKFKDTTIPTDLDSGVDSIADNTLTDILDVNVTIPSTRKLPIGTLSKYYCYIYVYTEAVAKRISEINDAADPSVAAKACWWIYEDDAAKDWTEKKNDDCEAATNPTFGVGARGWYFKECDAGDTFNIKIKVHQRTGGATDCRCHMVVLITPWILPLDTVDVWNPFTLDFPQGSTLYMIAESLFPPKDNQLTSTIPEVTKNIKVGAIDKCWKSIFGDANNYYKKESSTGIQSFNYTYEIIQKDYCFIFVDGRGGCISAIAADVR